MCFIRLCTKIKTFNIAVKVKIEQKVKHGGSHRKSDKNHVIIICGHYKWLLTKIEFILLLWKKKDVMCRLYRSYILIHVHLHQWLWCKYMYMYTVNK